jgi:hypothetical protein
MCAVTARQVVPVFHAREPQLLGASDFVAEQIATRNLDWQPAGTIDRGSWARAVCTRLLTALVLMSGSLRV